MNVTILTPPQSEPVSLDEVYPVLRIDEVPDTAQQAMLQRHIATARREVERITHRALVRQQLRLSCPSFLDVALARPPVISIESVEYYDSGNILQPLASDSWYVTDDEVPQLALARGVSIATYQRRDAVRVTYWAGYPAGGSPADDWIANVPSEAKEAILIGVQLLYQSLDAATVDRMERARDAMLTDLKVYGVA